MSKIDFQPRSALSYTESLAIPHCLEVVHHPTKEPDDLKAPAIATGKAPRKDRDLPAAHQPCAGSRRIGGMSDYPWK